MTAKPIPKTIARVLGADVEVDEIVSDAGTPDISGAGLVGRVDPVPESDPEPEPVPVPGEVVVPLVAGGAGAAIDPAGAGHNPRIAAMSSGRLMGIVLVPQLTYCAK